MRRFHFKSATHHNVRRIVQLQMTHWQDFTVPRKDDFCRFLNQYRDDLDSLGPSNTVPVLVHCRLAVSSFWFQQYGKLQFLVLHFLNFGRMNRDTSTGEHSCICRRRELG